MHLFNLQDFADRFGINLTVQDFHDAVQRASVAATRDMASRFRFQSFDIYPTRRDTFYVDRTFFDDGGNVCSFILSRGFVTESTIQARYTSNPIHIRNNETDSFIDLQDTAEDGKSDHLIIDADRGILSTFMVDLTRKWVVVDYSGGLSVATDDEYEGVPAWLSELAMAQTALNLANHVMFQTEDEGNDLTQLYDVIRRGFAAHARFKPEAYDPTMTEVL